MRDTLTGVDLDLVTEDHEEEPCAECAALPDLFPASVATWYVHYTKTCCLPNPLPICEGHKIMYDQYIAAYGLKFWCCDRCGDIADLVAIRRKH